MHCREPLINCCPVCGEILEVSDNLNTMIHLTLCFDEGTGNQVMTGGFLTDKQASSGWEPCYLFFIVDPSVKFEFYFQRERERERALGGGCLIMLYFSMMFIIIILWQGWNCKTKLNLCRWMFKLSEWAHFSSYDIGLNSGASASHIVVCFLSWFFFFFVHIGLLY